MELGWRLGRGITSVAVKAAAMQAQKLGPQTLQLPTGTHPTYL